MTDRTWAILNDYSYTPVEVLRETVSTVFYEIGGRETRTQKAFPWRGSELDARKGSEQLKSARAERDRRTREAHASFAKRVAEITRGTS